MKNNFFTDRNVALNYLLEKYQADKKGQLNASGQLELNGATLPLLPWRVERRFVELKNLIENKTLEDVSTFRFAHLMPQGEQGLDDLIYQQLDLCEWLGGATVKRLFAVFHGENAVNMIVKLDNDISCSVECSVMLPVGAVVIDRHEIIARRGVASDQVVDSQVPQSSIYSYTTKSAENFTDTDAEIFGLPQADIDLVRAGFKLITEPATTDIWQRQHQHLLKLIMLAKKSDTNGTPSIVAGEK